MTEAKLDIRQPRAWVRHPVVRYVLPLAILILALVALRQVSQAVHWSDVQADLAAAPWSAIATAFGLTAVSYAALSLYDVVSLRAFAPGKVPAVVAAAGGAGGFAISNLIAPAALTSGALRLRIYGALGVEPGVIAHVVAMTWLAFTLGITLALGLLFCVHPAGISAVLPVSPALETGAGLALLALLAALALWLRRGARHLDLGPLHVTFPSLGAAALITVIAVADLAAAAGALYVLLPADIGGNVAFFFLAYLVAVAFGFLSHAPGGIGVFEAALITELGAAGRSDVLAALVVYRVIYYLVPFALAAVGLGLAWAVTRPASVGRMLKAGRRAIDPVAPAIAAAVAVLTGVVLLVSGSLPAVDARLGLLRGLLPLPLVEASHLAGSIAGVLLLVTARGLYRRLYRAWLVAEALLILGVVASLVKGLDWEEAGVMLLAAAGLAVFRGAFYRVEGGSVFRLDARWVVSLVGLLSALIWIGALAHSNVAYRDALWWQFAWNGDASRFLRGSLAAAVFLAGISFQSLLVARSRMPGGEPIPDAVRALVQSCPRTSAKLALIGDKSFLVAKDGSAFLAYADTGGTLIAQGDPVGAPEASRHLILQLRERADLLGRRCAFNAVSTTYLTSYLDVGLTIQKIGEVARINLATFSLDGSARKPFRYAMARAARDGLVFQVIPAAEVAPLLPELKSVSDAWLARKLGEEKGFVLGAFSDAYLVAFDLAVLRRGEGGPILAFANIWRGADRHEVAPDLMRYDPAGPAMAMDALFASLLLWAKAEGFAWFSLGAAPFAGLDDNRFVPFWGRMANLVYRHGEQFYHFEGLRAFKQKFDPVWTPLYLACPRGLAVPRVLYEISVLISDGPRCATGLAAVK
jgi:phosphatidylglycerol lysyltransferase